MQKKNNPITQIDAPFFEKIHDNHNAELVLKGRWVHETIACIEEDFLNLNKSSAPLATINIEHITQLDTAGAYLICQLIFQGKQKPLAMKGERPDWLILFNTVKQHLEKQQTLGNNVKALSKDASFLARLGKQVTEIFLDLVCIIDLLGALIVTLVENSKNKDFDTRNFKTFLIQIGRIGAGAVPIVSLLSFIIGAIIAQQGALQLHYFGADILVVNLAGFLIFRELGVLLTSILVAARSASSITAEIGSMKIREEIDALQIMGLNTFRVLILPRILALILVLPLLTIVADISALIGASLAVNWYSNIDFHTFFISLTQSFRLKVYAAGLIKAPFIALALGIIATMEGMKVAGSAESLAQRVASSVVKSIFLTIVLDGLFAVFYGAIHF